MDGLQEAEALIAQLHRDDPEFRQFWDKAVQLGADRVCADIVGGRMAGREGGGVDWHATVPYPNALPRELTDLAYRAAVQQEAYRRLEAMGYNVPGIELGGQEGSG